MNEASKTPMQRKGAALFAPGVYDEDRDDARPEAAAGAGALASLRSELRGEHRALRTALARPRMPIELVAEIATLRAAVDELLAAPKRGDALAAMVRTRGVEGPAAAALARAAKKKEGKSHQEKLSSAAQAMVKTTPWPVAAREGRSIIALVGPAGVGKTTTAAKLAARAMMGRKTVALVSCDGFRVGAMDQLGGYADLMDARFHAANSPAELAEILEKETADVIIIDTPGRAIEPESTEAYLGSPELRRAGKGGGRREVTVLLCVPASLRSSDAARVHRDFSSVQPTALVITKLDETDTPAGIIHAAFATKLPVSTLCTGQRVPEDIAPATSASIGAALFPESSKSDV